MTVSGKDKRGLVEKLRTLRTRLDRLERRNAELVHVEQELRESLEQFKTIFDVTGKKQAEDALRKAHDELEMRVQERTAELQQANEALQAEIAERVKTEHTLIASELQYRTTLDSMGDAIHVVDSELRVVLLNERFRKWSEELGFEVGHPVGRMIFEMFPFLPETVRDEYRRVFEDGRGLTTEEVTRIAGREVATETRKIPIRQEDRVVGVVTVVRDITEHKKAEGALRESQERLKILFESAPDAIYLTDLKGRFVDGNRAAEELVGFAKAELIGKSLAESGLLSAEQLPQAAANLRKVAAGEPSGPSEYTVRRKSGSLIAVEVRTFPVRISDQVLSLGIARDVTARKRAEESLRASEKKFRSIFETAANLITSVNERGIIVDCNDRVREFLGYEKEEILGRSMAKIIHADYLDKAQSALKEILAHGFSYNKEYKMVRKDGSLIDVNINSSAIDDENGKNARTLCIIDNITERKQAQQGLLDDREQLKLLASALSLTEERERRRLATELHDQIGQSLVISKIKLDQLRKNESSGKLAGALDDVSACLGQVINETRTLTFDLSYPILYELGFEAAVAEWLTEHIQEKHGIETDFEDDGQSKPLDDDIQALLFRNVRELLINVVKHARARRVKVTTHKVKDHIRISVEDDGVGFDPVEVTAMAAKRAEFGLFSIRERLEQLGGLFEVVSAPGRGTRVTMTAPLKYKKREG